MVTSTTILTGQFCFNGAPWINVSNAAQATLNSLYFGFNGAPWWGYSLSIPIILGHIKAVNQVDWAKVKKFNGVSQANIKTIINVEG